jgi:glyoxylase-like metal-dependent hydrolase (beta-lactamase superfamily II)
MELYTIETGYFGLDGGAMFGVVPKPLWERTNPANAANRIRLAMRCLLVVDGERRVLVDCGLGHKYDSRFAGLYDLDHSITLDSSLHRHGLTRADITDLVLTHLHFDHAGGTTERVNGQVAVAFPHARIHVQRQHLAHALAPNAREKASFFDDHVRPIAEWEGLVLHDSPTTLFEGFDLVTVHGHTDAMQLPVLTYKNRKLLYAADLIPTHGHVPLPYVMGYDIRLLDSLREREYWLPRLADEAWVVLFEHDPDHACGTVVRTERGGYQAGEVFGLDNL